METRVILEISPSPSLSWNSLMEFTRLEIALRNLHILMDITRCLAPERLLYMLLLMLSSLTALYANLKQFQKH